MIYLINLQTGKTATSTIIRTVTATAATTWSPFSLKRILHRDGVAGEGVKR